MVDRMDFGTFNPLDWGILAGGAFCLTVSVATILDRRVLASRLVRARVANKSLRTELAIATAALTEIHRQQEYFTIVDGPMSHGNRLSGLSATEDSDQGAVV
jgi:hypothetical protein